MLFQSLEVKSHKTWLDSVYSPTDLYHSLYNVYSTSSFNANTNTFKANTSCNLLKSRWKSREKNNDTAKVSCTFFIFYSTIRFASGWWTDGWTNRRSGRQPARTRTRFRPAPFCNSTYRHRGATLRARARSSRFRYGRSRARLLTVPVSRSERFSTNRLTRKCSFIWK